MSSAHLQETPTSPDPLIVGGEKGEVNRAIFQCDLQSWAFCVTSVNHLRYAQPKNLTTSPSLKPHSQDAFWENNPSQKEANYELNEQASFFLLRRTHRSSRCRNKHPREAAMHQRRRCTLLRPGFYWQGWQSLVRLDHRPLEL